MPFARPLLLVIGLALAAGSAQAQEKPFSDAKKVEIGEIVKAYLMSHPELIQEALNELDKKQRDAEAEAQKSAVTALSPELTKAENGVVLGNPSGDVTLVEFFDYNCGYCKKAMSDIMGLIKADPKLRVVLRDFPVLGPDSVEASKVALAVRNQLTGAKYMEFHQKLLESRGRIGKDRAIEVAKSLGADPAKIEKDLESAEIKKLLGGTMRAADQLRIGGTPAFVVADGVIVGAVGQEALADTIKSARACGKSVC